MCGTGVEETGCGAYPSWTFSGGVVLVIEDEYAWSPHKSDPARRGTASVDAVVTGWAIFFHNDNIPIVTWAMFPPRYTLRPQGVWGCSALRHSWTFSFVGSPPVESIDTTLDSLKFGMYLRFSRESIGPTALGWWFDHLQVMSWITTVFAKTKIDPSWSFSNKTRKDTTYIAPVFIWMKFQNTIYRH